MESNWGTSADPERVATTYREHPKVKGAFVVYSETSTGALNDVEAIGRIFRDTNVVVVVDAISGLLVHSLEMDTWGLDVVLAASHKGFSLRRGSPSSPCPTRRGRPWSAPRGPTTTGPSSGCATSTRCRPRPPRCPCSSPCTSR
ncbi:aminotransferase class V-fold PLP-dependent enzyme [Streptomyces sp. 796.1]|uniref:aminotransferase class V-fold PLP-dependent enzyme n=1 Tax=Streptomyces sp. 796.1 TaxID=3163029 RepID=UPI0039C9F58E